MAGDGAWLLLPLPQPFGPWPWTLPGAAEALAGWRRDHGPRRVPGRASPDLAALIQAATVADTGLELLPRHEDPDRRSPSDRSGGGLRVRTSGSTGSPHLHHLSTPCLLAAAASSSAHLGLGPATPWLACLPCDHVGGVMSLLRAAWSGCPVLLLPRWDAEAATQAIDDGLVAGAGLVPAMLHDLLVRRAGRPWPDTLRTLLIGGASLPLGTRRACGALGRWPCSSYGLTETCGLVCAQDAGGSPADDAGRPLPGVRLRCGADGRLQIRAPQAGPGWLRTTDRAVISADHRLRILGRADSLIVCGGEKIDLEALTATLRRHPAVRDAVTVALDDARLGQVPAAVLSGVPDPGFPDWLAAQMPAAQRIRRWVWTADLPRLAGGKTDLRAARALLEPGSPVTGTDCGPSSPLPPGVIP